MFSLIRLKLWVSKYSALGIKALYKLKGVLVKGIVQQRTEFVIYDHMLVPDAA